MHNTDDLEPNATEQPQQAYEKPAKTARMASAGDRKTTLWYLQKRRKDRIAYQAENVIPV